MVATLARAAMLGAALGLAMGCRVPRRVHDPLEFPATRIAASHLALLVPEAVATPPEGSLDRGLPAGFRRDASARLATLVSGQGPALDVTVTSANVSFQELLDARGETTRVSVDLELEVRVRGGPVLRRARTGSRSDIPRDEATPEELEFVLGATAVNAFERYFARAQTPARLNADLAAYLERHPEAAPR